MIAKLLRLSLRVGLVAAVAYVIARIVENRDRPAAVPAPAPSPAWPRLATPEPTNGSGPSSEPAPAPEAATEPDPEPDDGAAYVEPDGDVCPSSHPIKAKLSSKIFHLPGMLNYDRTNPDRCYATAEAAEADGLRAAKR